MRLSHAERQCDGRSWRIDWTGKDAMRDHLRLKLLVMLGLLWGFSTGCCPVSVAAEVENRVQDDGAARPARLAARGLLLGVAQIGRAHV